MKSEFFSFSTLITARESHLKRLVKKTTTTAFTFIDDIKFGDIWVQSNMSSDIDEEADYYSSSFDERDPKMESALKNGINLVLDWGV